MRVLLLIFLLSPIVMFWNCRSLIDSSYWSFYALALIWVSLIMSTSLARFIELKAMHEVAHVCTRVWSMCFLSIFLGIIHIYYIMGVLIFSVTNAGVSVEMSLMARYSSFVVKRLLKSLSCHYEPLLPNWEL